jgi:hypothetical protein
MPASAPLDSAGSLIARRGSRSAWRPCGLWSAGTRRSSGSGVSLVIAPFGGTLAPYEALVRRFRATRFLFGIEPAPRLTDLEGHTK